MDKKEFYAGAGRAAIEIPERSGGAAVMYARAVIMKNGNSVCLVSVEVGVPQNSICALREAICRQTGVEAGNVWILAAGGCSGQPVAGGYSDAVRTAVAPRRARRPRTCGGRICPSDRRAETHIPV